MKDENDILMMYNSIRDLGYNGTGDRDSKRRKFFTKKLPKLVNDIQNKTFDEISDDSDNELEGEGVKIIIPSNIVDIYTRLEILLGIKLSGHTDTLSEASNLIDELYKRGEIENKQQYQNALNKFFQYKMELPSKLLEQIAFNTGPKIEEHMLIIMDKSTHEERFFQPLQTNNKQFKIAVTFLTGYNGIFNVTTENNKFYFLKSITDDDHIQITIPEGSYEIESLNNEIKRPIIDEEHYTEANYPFNIKPNFSTLGSIIEIPTQGPVITFIPDDSIGNLLGFDKTTIFEEYNLSPNPVDILSFDNIFIETDIAKGMIFKGKRTGIIHNFTMDVDPGYKYIEKFCGGVQWYMMESKDIISTICFKSKNENGNLVSFNGQSITFRLSIKEI